jgi:hypothetical protein
MYGIDYYLFRVDKWVVGMACVVSLPELSLSNRPAMSRYIQVHGAILEHLCRYNDLIAPYMHPVINAPSESR